MKSGGEIYNILIEKADAPRNLKDYFCNWFECAEGDEFRFQGKLGFGGKYWKLRNKVSCYPEDENRSRREIIEETNKALNDQQKTEGGVG